MVVTDKATPGSEPELYVPSAPPAASAPDIESAPEPQKPKPSTTAAPASTPGPVVSYQKLGTTPFQHTCSNCNHAGLTRTTSQPTAGAWVSCCLLVLFFWPLFWVPFVIPACKKTSHYCKNCGVLVGTSE
mmetsp:Transcript_9875/g.14795  ORF Transcript_9875/g.14795 Transcript_9875/m.14795 type:complete len:130 (+) Transcript_9875:80-469(+)